MPKVGLITMHHSDNYGAVLQCYALVNALERIGADVEVINYIPKRFQTGVQFFYVHPRRYHNAVQKYLVMAVSLPVRGLIYARYSAFLKRHIPVGKQAYYSEADLENRTPAYDVYLSGSDQVWNPDFEGRLDPAFFLKFAPDSARKAAYASSFGKSELTEAEFSQARQLLSRYDLISVREESGKRLVSQMGLDARYLLDPSFLLTGDQWQDFAATPRLRDPYVLVYQLNPNPRLLEIADRIAKARGLKVVKFGRDVKKRAGVDINLAFRPPEEFVTMIANADYVVTDSFHGTAFSINLHKKFVVVMPPKYSDRLGSILSKLGLEDRLNEDLWDSAPDYVAVDRLLEQERKQSEAFLRQCVYGE